MITLQARQLMAPALGCLNETDSVVLAARRMRALSVSAVPVQDRHSAFLGMVFERDIFEHCVAAGVDPRSMPVVALLRGPQETVSARRIADASVLGMVLRQPLGQLPVVDEGVLVGIITLAGIAAHLIDDDELDETARPSWWPADDRVRNTYN